ncbi:MAG: flagellar motor switch phosphatase FliY [bacterium]
MNDKMSQEDIDNILKGSSGEIPPENNPIYKFLTEEEADTLGEISNIFMGSASTILSMLLSNKVDITTPVVCEYTNVEESFVVKEDHIVVSIKYVEGLEGTTVFALKVKDTAIIADLMMGGEGNPQAAEIGELELSAVGEAMNQMVGSASTSLSSMFNYPINISHPEVKLQEKDKKLDLADEILSNPIIAVKFRLIIGTLIDSEIIQVMSVKSAQNQVARLMNMMTALSEGLSAPSNTVVPEAKAAPQPQTVPQSNSQYQTPPIHQQAPPASSPSTAYNHPPQMPEPPQRQVTVQPVQFASFDNSSNIYGEVNQNLNLVMDVKLELTVELGRSVLPIKNVLELTRGSIIELDKIAGEPVELYANGKLIAKGEVVVIEDNFGLRVTSIISPENRIKDL